MTDKPNWFERHSKKTLFLVVAVFIIFALGFTEYLLEQGLPQQPVTRSIRLKEHTPLTHGVHAASKRGLKMRGGVAVDNLEETDYLFRTDEQGFIMPSKVHETPDLSMVFLGGSTTECNFVEEESRFPYLSGVLLGQKLGKKINSYNSGVSGNNTMHCLDLLLNKVLAMRPDIVLLMENFNDVNILLFTGSYWNDHGSRSLLVTSDRGKGRGQRLWEAFTETVFPGISYRLHSSILGGRNLDEFARERTSGAVSEAITSQDYEANLVNFVQICNARGIMPVLMTQFNRFSATPDDLTKKAMRKFGRDWGVDYGTYKGYLDSFNDVAREVATEHNGLLIDLDKQVPKNNAYIYDVVHINTEGSKLVASLIAEQLAQSVEVQNLLRAKNQSLSEK